MNRVPTVGTPCIGIVSCEFYVHESCCA